MKFWRGLFSALTLLTLATFSGDVRAAQGTGCLPLSGLYSAVAITAKINAGFAALISTNSGITAPATDCGNAPVTGQLWIDTSISTLPRFAVFDGSSWLSIGSMDATNHIWEPPIGGGVANIASNTTTDLCSKTENYINVTGSAVISQFGGTNCAIGQIKVVNFPSTPTLVHNTSAIKLPTANAITAQAGDVAIAAYLGAGAWNVLSYTRANGTALTAASVPPVHYAGQTISMRTQSCPDGSIVEDGSAISRSTYAQLYAAIGTTWGAGDGSTTFNLPNTGGQFERGWVPGQTVDSARTFGVSQADGIGSHTHPFSGSGGYLRTREQNQVITAGNDGSVNAGSLNGTVTISGTTGANNGNIAETRPKNITSLHCIFVANSP